MKKTIITMMLLIFAGALSFNAYALNISLSVNNNGNSAWRCEAGNRYGNAWYAVASTRSEARRVAYNLCERYTYGWGRCNISNCTQVQQARYSGRWQCNVMSTDGQVWFGVGKTSQSAKYNAMGYCRSNSWYPRSCDPISCFKR